MQFLMTKTETRTNVGTIDVFAFQNQGKKNKQINTWTHCRCAIKFSMKFIIIVGETNSEAAK